jgi:hypothetical protein
MTYGQATKIERKKKSVLECAAHVRQLTDVNRHAGNEAARRLDGSPTASLPNAHPLTLACLGVIFLPHECLSLEDFQCHESTRSV